VAQRSSSRQKRKRKQRAATRRKQPMATGYARARQRDDEARAALVPLEPGERPLAVTIGALVATVGALSNLVALAFDPDQAGALILGALIAGLVAYGMWRARYWGVLGMQTILGFTIVGAALALVFANSVVHAALAALIVAAAGTLFWFLVKAMARIQMPDRPGASRSP
jgi:hypothetical protein